MDLFVETDPLGRSVRLTENCHRYHIAVNHPDMEDSAVIQECIRSPERIATDATEKNRFVYYRTYQQDPQRWYKVVVELGEVVTAYRVGRLQKGESTIWQR